MGTKIYWIGIIGALLILTGCYNHKNLSTSIEKIANAELAISKAQDSKAPEFAPQELREAQEKWQNAKKALQNKNYDEAARLAEQALIDATLAEARAELEMERQVGKREKGFSITN